MNRLLGVLYTNRERIWFGRDELMDKLGGKEIGTRTFFISMNVQPAFRKMGLFKNEKYPVAEEISVKGLYLPSSVTLTEKQIQYIVETIVSIQRSS